MAQSAENLTFLMRRSGIDSADDHWLALCDANITAWTAAQRTLASRTTILNGAQIRIDFDWHPAARSWSKYKTAMNHLISVRQSGSVFTLKDLDAFQKIKTRIPITAHSTNEINRYHIKQLVETTLADIFLIMNISAPGSCDFYASTLIEKRSSTDKLHDKSLSLSNFPFELAMTDGLSGTSIKLETIDLDHVSSWFCKIRSGTRQIPQNSLEKVLFGLLRISHDELSPTSVIWLFYCIETLLATSPTFST
jgi:hypothetical protein